MFRQFLNRSPILLLLLISTVTVAHAQMEPETNKTEWYKPSSAATVLDRDVYDQEAHQLMDRSVPEMLSTLGSPHSIHRDPASRSETWIYFVVPKPGAPYIMEMLVGNGRIHTISRHFLSDFISK